MSRNKWCCLYGQKVLQCIDTIDSFAQFYFKFMQMLDEPNQVRAAISFGACGGVGEKSLDYKAIVQHGDFFYQDGIKAQEKIIISPTDPWDHQQQHCGASLQQVLTNAI